MKDQSSTIRPMQEDVQLCLAEMAHDLAIELDRCEDILHEVQECISKVVPNVALSEVSIGLQKIDLATQTVSSISSITKALSKNLKTATFLTKESVANCAVLEEISDRIWSKTHAINYQSKTEVGTVNLFDHHD